MRGVQSPSLFILPQDKIIPLNFVQRSLKPFLVNNHSMTTEGPRIEKQEGSDRSRSPSVESDNSNFSRGNNKSNHNATHLRPTLQGTSRSVSSSNISVNTSSLTPHRKPHPSRLKSHNRSLSHNKLLNKLSTSTAPATTRPNLNRSKSTDGLTKGGRHTATIKRNNRSFTKITGLQPLTKTISNQSVKSNKSNSSLKGLSGAATTGGIKPMARKGKATLNLDDDDKEYEDVDEPPDESDDVVAPRPERFDSQETVSTTQLDSDQNIPSLYEQINRILPDPTPQNDVVYNNGPKLDVVDEGKPLDGNVAPSKNEPKRPDLVSSVQSSTEDVTQSNNLYGSSLLLSQSTGIVRKIEPVSAKVTEVYSNKHDPNVPQQPESVSGISFKANPMEAVNSNIAKPVTTNQNVSQKNSYQPDQTIFTNLQRTNNQYMQNKQGGERVPETRPIQNNKNANPLNNGANNYNEFLRSTSSSTDLLHGPSKNIETRTQQKLWLQRESSLLDVTNMDPARRSNFSNLSLNNLMFSHNYNQSHSSGQWPSNPNSYQSQHGISSTIVPLTPVTPGNVQGVPGFSSGMLTPDRGGSTVNVNGLLHMVQNAHQNSIQSRTEFERLNREYLNVRRHLNPVGESLNRIQNLIGDDSEIKVAKSKKRPDSGNPNANTFKEYVPSFQTKQAETMGSVNKIWQDAILSTLTSSRTGSYSQENITNQQLQPSVHRMSSFGQSSPYNKHGQHSSGRAVKLAQSQSHNG